MMVQFPHLRTREPLPFGKRRPFFPPGSLIAVGGALVIGLGILAAHTVTLRLNPDKPIVSALAPEEIKPSLSDPSDGRHT